MRGLEVWFPRYWRKCSFSGFEIGFAAFPVVFLALCKCFCVNQRYGCQDTDENFYSPFLKPVFVICRSSLINLEVVLRRPEVLLPRYGRKPLFASFENGFTVVAVVLLVPWRLLCNHGRFRCQDTGKNVYLPSFKLVKHHSLFNF